MKFFLNNKSAGFTLIEISLVLLLFGSAVGGLLSFFSVGLRQENSAMSDTVQSMFAFDVLGQIEAKAAEINDLSIWNSEKSIKSKLQNNLTVGTNSKKIKFTGIYKGIGNDDKFADKSFDMSELLEDYPKERSYIRYNLDIVEVRNPVDFGKDGSPRLWRVSIWVTDRRDAIPTDNTPFIVDLAYQGGLDDVLNIEE